METAVSEGALSRLQIQRAQGKNNQPAKGLEELVDDMGINLNQFSYLVKTGWSKISLK